MKNKSMPSLSSTIGFFFFFSFLYEICTFHNFTTTYIKSISTTTSSSSSNYNTIEGSLSYNNNSEDKISNNADNDSLILLYINKTKDDDNDDDDDENDDSIPWSIRWERMIANSKRNNNPININNNNDSDVITTTSNSNLVLSLIIRYMESLSSVDYVACCGLGHRLVRATDAYYIATKLVNFTFRSDWKLCDDINIYEYLFGPPLLDELVGGEEGVGVGIEEELKSLFTNNKHVLLPDNDDNNNTTTNMKKGSVIRIRNNAMGFSRLIRKGGGGMNNNSDNNATTTTNSEICKDCSLSKFHSDVEYYKSLIQRFRYRKYVTAFLKKHNFHAYTVYGIHIRAGNNETGDFNDKGRTIHNPKLWITNVCKQILDIIQFTSNNNNNNEKKKPPLLFVATDTPKMIFMLEEIMDDLLSSVGGGGYQKTTDIINNNNIHNRSSSSSSRIHLPEKIKIIDYYEQYRRREGTGVMFGTPGNVVTTGKECIKGWKDALIDMMILSLGSDVVIAPRISSFTQSMPLTLALSSSPDNKKEQKYYCEMNYNATSYRCYNTYLQWCCHGNSFFTNTGLNHIHEYRKFMKSPNYNYTKHIFPREHYHDHLHFTSSFTQKKSK